MKFMFHPKGEYKPGQIIEVHGRQWRIVSVAHTGTQLEVTAHTGKAAHAAVILTDEPPIKEQS